jgi:hypothetical protein
VAQWLVRQAAPHLRVLHGRAQSAIDRLGQLLASFEA